MKPFVGSGSDCEKVMRLKEMKKLKRDVLSIVQGLLKTIKTRDWLKVFNKNSQGARSENSNKVEEINCIKQLDYLVSLCKDKQNTL